MTEPELPTSIQPAPVRKRGLLKLFIRIAVGAAVLAFLFVKADLHQLWHTLQQARVSYLVIAAGAIFGGLLVSALRWKAYLDALEMPLPYATLYRLYFVGTFFNAFLPTGVGGDAYKAVRLGRDRESMAPAFASVFLDRFAGIVGMAGIGLASSAYLIVAGKKDHHGTYALPLIALALCVGVLGAAIVLLWGGERLLGRGRLIKHEGIGGRLRRAVRQVHAAGRHPEAAARGYFYGVVFQGFVFMYHVMLGRALGLKGVPVMAFASIVVLSSLATMLPSINGLGFREGAYIWALGRFGIGHNQAFAYGLLVDALLYLTSLAGGLVYLVRGGEVHRTDRASSTVGSAPA